MDLRYPDLADRRTGVVTFYDPDANFGFIDPDDDAGDVVFALRPGDPPIQVGDSVVFEVAPEPLITPMGAQALRVWKAGFADSR